MAYVYVLHEENNNNIRVFDNESLALKEFWNNFAEFLQEKELEIHHYDGCGPTIWKKSSYCYGNWIADLRKVKLND